ncbi:sarcosine oxidase subunit gamma [Alphaproteobacteria bacterium]|nr:sarcosine oxidase subunit gamma [Alphaproteobacteria bacterium]
MAEAIMKNGVAPLDGVIGPIGGPANAGALLSERRHRGKLVLRGDPDDKNFLAGAAKALGMAPPTAPNTAASSWDLVVIWTAPDEWLVVTEPSAESALEATLAYALNGTHHAVTNTSDHSTIIRLSGADARTIMAKGCALDLHTRAFRPGDAAQSHLARALVTFWQVDEVPTYDILVLSSFAAYLWAWLVDASLEFGVRVEA